ncbi:MAG TPA: ATP-dependent DNA helicase RecG [Alphaproteobacteria bacterium]|nr:ATP-dependent DNA helicase RecG [Alphaproteobacteria bacterium]
MRPEILFPLFAPATALPGIGPRLAKLVEKLAGPRAVDLLWHLPSGIIDRRYAPKVVDAQEGRIATITVKVEAHLPPRNRRLPYRVRCADDSGELFLVFFHARPDYLAKVLPVGETRVVSGKIEHFRDAIQMTHPDHIGTLGELASLQSVEPVYRLTAGLTMKPLTKAIRGALDRAPDLPEWIESNMAAQHGWASWRESLRTAHAPAAESDLSPDTPARSRLAYDELLANQLALALIRATQRRLPGRSVTGDGRLSSRVMEALPYKLTSSQVTALEEIRRDMAAPTRMLRLLQGDVGSGKTVVAFLAMLSAVEAGHQAALMAPTEILARQHMATIEPLVAAAGVSVALLTGREKGKAKAKVYDGLKSGEIRLVIGTHALFQEEVAFADLALAVVDEQHRFGVHQRLALAEKAGRGAESADVLVMTATPIPRTMMLTVYGDLEVSRLTEKPAGRKPVDTRAIPLERLEEVIAAVARAVENQARVYWVCPLVAESEALDLAAAEARHAELATRFGSRVGLVHGRMKGADKDQAMEAFSRGDSDILVATTVIEVGVDVPDATVMVIEHAERFGLAQLHQLRGRVGRSARPSTCLLLYAAPLTESARARLSIMRETDDGFRIAEEDLRLRGAGEVLGTRQSGVPEFRLADIVRHEALLAAARDDAELVLQRDPELGGARGVALRVLLYLFQRDAVVGTLRSG